MRYTLSNWIELSNTLASIELDGFRHKSFQFCWSFYILLLNDKGRFFFHKIAKFCIRCMNISNIPFVLCGSLFYAGISYFVGKFRLWLPNVSPTYQNTAFRVTSFSLFSLNFFSTNIDIWPNVIHAIQSHMRNAHLYTMRVIWRLSHFQISFFFHAFLKGLLCFIRLFLLILSWIQCGKTPFHPEIIWNLSTQRGTTFFLISY